MNKIARLFAIASLAAAAAGATCVGKSLAVFATEGPDLYADGSAVADGESYFLVFVPEGAGNWAVDSEGAIVGGAELKGVIAAKGGRCPAFNYQFTPEKFGRGALVLIMLDTRGADGKPGLANGVHGASVPTGTIGTGSAALTYSSSSAVNAGAAGLALEGAIALPAGAQFAPPAISALEIGSDGAGMKVSAMDIGQYAVYRSTDLKNWEPVPGASGLRAAALRDISIAGGGAVGKAFFQIRSNVVRQQEGE